MQMEINVQWLTVRAFSVTSILGVGSIHIAAVNKFSLFSISFLSFPLYLLWHMSHVLLTVFIRI